jgi:hypothetical protein
VAVQEVRWVEGGSHTADNYKFFYRNENVLTVHASIEDKDDDMKDNSYEELEHVFDKFLKHHVNIKLGDFSEKVGRKHVLKPTVGNESLHEISNDSRIRVLNFTCQKI